MKIEYNIGIKRIMEVNACRTCGNSTVEESRRWAVHSNGYWNESVEFGCGAKYVFSPNFMQVGQATICRNNKEFKARQDLLETIKQEIFSLGELRGLHPDDLKQLKSSLEYWEVYR